MIFAALPESGTGADHAIAERVGLVALIVQGGRAIGSRNHVLPLATLRVWRLAHPPTLVPEVT